VDGDGAGWVIDGDGQFQHFNQQRGHDAGDDADDQRRHGRNQGCAGARGDQAGEPAIGAEAGVGLAEANASHRERGQQCAGCGQQRVDDGRRQRGKRGVQPEKVAGGIEGHPSGQCDEAAEENVDGVVAGHGGGDFSLREFAAPGPGDPCDGQRAEAAQDVNDGGAGGVEEA
jgi:hypothetical protein